jgi:hypothetical protein
MTQKTILLAVAILAALTINAHAQRPPWLSGNVPPPWCSGTPWRCPPPAIGLDDYAAAPEELPPPTEPPPEPLPRPLAPPPSLGWVYGPYLLCTQPGCFVSVDAAGANVRTAPNGPPILALVNGTPVIVRGRAGNWIAIDPACYLTPTFLWSWTAGVSLMRCWI